MHYIPPRNVWDYVERALCIGILLLWTSGIYIIIHFVIKFW